MYYKLRKYIIINYIEAPSRVVETVAYTFQHAYKMKRVADSYAPWSLKMGLHHRRSDAGHALASAALRAGDAGILDPCSNRKPRSRNITAVLRNDMACLNQTY
jgi:hypothetical protein